MDLELARFVSLRDIQCLEGLEVAPPGATLLPSNGWIISPGMCLEEHSVIDAPEHKNHRPGFRNYLIQSLASRRLTRRVVPALSFRTFGETNYFHFLNDLLGGRLRLADELEESRGLPIVISETLAQSRFFQDIAGFPNLQTLEWIVQGRSQPFKSDALYFGATSAFSSRSPEFVQRLLGVPDADPSATNRLLVLRRHNAGRSLVNHREIVESCAHLGFRPIDPGSMSVHEQIEAFSNARFVVGMHGAALANLMFRRNAPLDLVELLPGSAAPYAHYFHLCHVLGFRYQAVEAIATQAANAEFFVDAEVLGATLRSVLDRAG